MTSPLERCACGSPVDPEDRYYPDQCTTCNNIERACYHACFDAAFEDGLTISHLMGLAMRRLKGRGNPSKVKELLRSLYPDLP